ncbi:MAG: M35 family metallo-endopeptidase [Paracoccaceae bacterium]
MRFLIFVSILLFAAIPARAEFVNCNTAQIGAIQKAMSNARDAVSIATTAIHPDSTIYERWFGRWDNVRATDVRRSLAAIKAVLDEDILRVNCARPLQNGCTGTVYANVWPDQPYQINICRNFFNLPQLSGDKSRAGFNHVGTMAGTMVHELSHFDTVAATDDHVYTRGLCIDLARDRPELAVRNADSYQYFIEDAFLKGM